MSEIVILVVGFQLKQLKKQPVKSLGLNGTRTHDVAIPGQCSIQSAIKPHGYIYIYIYIYITKDC